MDDSVSGGALGKSSGIGAFMGGVEWMHSGRKGVRIFRLEVTWELAAGGADVRSISIAAFPGWLGPCLHTSSDGGLTSSDAAQSSLCMELLKICFQMAYTTLLPVDPAGIVS